MNLSNTIELVEAHAEGEIGRVVTAGLPPIPGQSISDKFRYMLNEGDDIRLSLCLEPRGTAAGSVVLTFPPEDPENHAGIIILQPDQAHAMSGSNAICTTTVLLETGIVEVRDGIVPVRLETAAGLVIANTSCRNGKCQSVTLSMPASFVEELDVTVDTNQWGKLSVDIAFGGVYYAVIDPAQLDLSITPANARHLADAGMILKDILNQQISVSHPINPDVSGIAYVMFRENETNGTVRTATTMWPGRLDRSPCGTGNSANLAIRAARGEVCEGESYTSRSTIGSSFQVKHAGTTMVGDKQAVLPEIMGRGWIYGKHTVFFDPSDPFKGGFALTDTWGMDAGKIRP